MDTGFQPVGGWDVVALAVHTAHDDLLGMVAPFALALAHRTALVIDLDPQGLPLPGNRSLARMVEDGPTLDELVPSRPGLAVLPHGGVDSEAAAQVVGALAGSWPCVVVRSRVPLPGMPFVEVTPLIPGVVTRTKPRIWVRTGIGKVHPGPGPVVDSPGRSAVGAVLAGRMPAGRWVRSWSGVWSWPWQ